jgi:hypothetical protein
MKVSPKTWEFAGDYCCWDFQERTIDDGYSTPSIFTDGEKVFFGGATIKNCPFCGKKIELRREC